jgi:hypothetical protein
METYEHDSELDKDIPVKTEEIDFQTFLNLVTSSYLDNIKSCHEIAKNILDYDDIFIVEEYKMEVNKVLESYNKTNDIDKTLELLKEVTKYPVSYSNCSIQHIIKY